MLEFTIYSYIVKGSSEYYPKGSFPHKSSYIMTPKDHKST